MAVHPTPDGHLDARSAAAAAMRRLSHALTQRDVDDELLRRIAAQADATADAVLDLPLRQRRDAAQIRQMWNQPPPDGGAMAHFDHCIVSGGHNPMGVGMRVRRVGDRVEASAHLGAAFEGAPQRAHGGIVAAILDDVMGYVLLIERTPAYTGHLSVAYLAPTPVEAELVVTGWLDRRDGRKLYVVGTIADAEGAVLARGEGVFIAIPPDRLPALADDLGERA